MRAMTNSAGRPARAVQWAWLPILAAALAVCAASLPYRYHALSTFNPVTLPTGWTAPTWQAALAEHGVDGQLYALLRLGGDALFVLVFFSVATLLWLRARDRLTHYVAVFLLVFGLDWVQDLDVMPTGWYWPL